MKILNLIILLIIFIILNADGQTNFKVSFDSNFDITLVKIKLVDGPIFKDLNLKFSENTSVIKENFRSKYATLLFFYPNKNKVLTGISLLVNAKDGHINFTKDKIPNNNELLNYITKGGIDIRNNIETKRLAAYCIKESVINQRDSKSYELLQNDSNLKKYNESLVKLALKQLDYIKKNGQHYTLFWAFKETIVPTLKKNYLLELYNIFNTRFPKKYIDSYEGIILKKLLEGKLFVKVGNLVPKFSVKDNFGKIISSETLKEKYYIISFWASWCSPCIEKIPLLSKLSREFKSKNLEIISISQDKDSTQFTKAVNKYNMNWINIFNYPEMNNMFGAKPIPSLYLIDDKGIIIFSSWEKDINELEKNLINVLNN